MSITLDMTERKRRMESPSLLWRRLVTMKKKYPGTVGQGKVFQSGIKSERLTRYQEGMKVRSYLWRSKCEESRTMD